MFEFQRKPSAMRQRFVEEFLLRDDAKAAAIAAGYAPKHAAERGRYLLKDPWIAAAVRYRLDARAERTRIEAERVILELARIAFADVTRFVEWSAEGTMAVRPPSLLSAGDRAAIQRVVRHGDEIELVLHDKLRALDALGRYFKLWGKHAERFAVPPGTDIRTPAMEKARAALKARVEKIIAERDETERAAKLKEEEEWSAAWARAYSPGGGGGAMPGGGGGGAPSGGAG